MFVVQTNTFQFLAFFIYGSDGKPVTKTIQRQTLTSEVLSGSYSGSLSGSTNGCNNPANNVPSFNARFNLTVTQVDNSSATFVFTVVAMNEQPVNAVCTLNGAITQGGLLYSMPAASYSCPLSSATTAIINNFRVTGQGIEGRWHAQDGGGCTESVHFSGVDLSLK